jgi:Tol biopolymer transport system component
LGPRLCNACNIIHFTLPVNLRFSNTSDKKQTNIINTRLRREEMRNLIMCAAILLVAILTGPALAEWITPVPVTSGINTQSNEFSPFLSYDGLSLYFSRNINGFSIFEAKRNQPSGPFTSVTQVLNTPYSHVLAPWVSPDNLRLYYCEEGFSAWQIKVSQRASVNNPWPQGTAVSGLPTGACTPSLTEDELTIAFCSPTLSGVGGWDIWAANRPDRNSPFGNISNIISLNTTYDDTYPSISPDGLELYFGSNRLGATQLFEATRESLSDPFGNIEHLPFFTTSPFNTGQPCISSDGTALYFAHETGLPNQVDIFVSYNVPEPATIMLLGIGGVLLRRSKR